LEGLSDLKASISEGMDSIRATIHDIHDESIDLKTSLEELICDFSFCPAKLAYELSFQPQIKLRYCFIALVKEGLTNAIKHSNATEVSVLLKEEPGQSHLEIFDNGTLTSENKLKLIKAQARNEYSDGLGLQSMYDRVRSFHGTFQLNLNDGFKLIAIIPKEVIEHENITD
ncbi:MAG: sensor histidine kinase, partial [Acetivibrio ethanolgignens]